MKKWFQSKTMWLNLGTVVAGSVVVGMQTGLETNPMPEPWGGIVLGLLGAVNMFLRSRTSTGIAK